MQGTAAPTPVIVQAPPEMPGAFGLQSYQLASIIELLIGVTVTVIIALPIIRFLVRWAEARFLHAPRQTELDELRARLAELEAQQGRLLELEERLEFAERLLARPRESARQGGDA